MKSLRTLSMIAVLLIVFSSSHGQGKLITRVYTSAILKENKIGLDVNRSIKIYLPKNYETSSKSYPVVYFLHNIFWDNDRMFQDGQIVSLIDRAIATGVIKEFIFVVPDYRTSTTGSIYENSPISGRWLDHTIQEIIPYIDRNFRTIPGRESRALVGEFMGGRGAFKLAMTQPDVFSSMYALHPVATGMGQLPWEYIDVEWRKLYSMKSYSNENLSGRTQIFLTVSQAFLPNPDRAPLYCDFFMEPVDGVPAVHVDNLKKAADGFLIDANLAADAANLRKMAGIAFDWAQFDPTYAHVISNRELSRKLADLGVKHEAEEYNGTVFEKTWLDDGRFYARVLPFLSKHLVFDKKAIAK